MNGQTIPRCPACQTRGRPHAPDSAECHDSAQAYAEYLRHDRD